MTDFGIRAWIVTMGIVMVLLFIAHFAHAHDRLTLYYVMHVNRNNQAEPLGIFGPYSRAECREIARQSSGVWCQAIKAPR